jgi:hypothetical protein
MRRGPGACSGGGRRRERREAERAEERRQREQKKKEGREQQGGAAWRGCVREEAGSWACVCGGGSTWGLGVGWGRPNFRNRGIRLLEQIEMDKGSKGNHCGIGK